MQQKICIRKLPDDASNDVRSLIGVTLPAERYGPFTIAPMACGSSITLKVAVCVCPRDPPFTSIYVVMMLDVIQALQKAGKQFAALRYAKKYRELGVNALLQGALSFPIGDPAFDIEEVS